MQKRTHRGSRSFEAQKRRKQKFCEYVEEQRKRDIANQIVLKFSLYDPFNGDIIYHPECERVILDKLKVTFSYIPAYATSHDFGEVLNRFAWLPKAPRNRCVSSVLFDPNLERGLFRK